MCLEVFIGSEKELPLVGWDDANPGFYIQGLPPERSSDFLDRTLHSAYYYEAGSHLGCGCGLSYGEWSQTSEGENHQARVNDVRKLLLYLRENSKDNILKLFCTSWQKFPNMYEKKIFEISEISGNEFEFDFETDVILIVP